MAVRAVSLFERLEFEFQGTIYRNAIAFGDVDGDGGNELAVCNTSGHLLFFKAKSPKPWRLCNEDLGCITSIVINDAMNCGSSSTLCFSTEGRCFVFSQQAVRETQKRKENVHDQKQHSNTKGAKASPSHPSDILIKPSFVQDLPSNPKMAIVADIDGDGQNEVVACYSDRFVRVFRFKRCQRLATDRKQSRDEIQESTSSVKKLPKQQSKDEESKASLSVLVKQPSKDSESSKTPSPLSPKQNRKCQGKQEFSFDFADGKFELLQEFNLPGQVGSIASVKSDRGCMQLIASQPAGGYAVLAVYGDESDNSPKQLNKSAKDKCTQISQLDTFYPRAGIGLRHFIVNSDVIGSIKRQHNDSSLFCLCTLDGHYALIDANSSGSMLRLTTRATDHQWFKMDKIETSDGDDAIVLGSWDGMAHILDKNFDTASYNFGENICGFCAGSYCIDNQNNVPSLCFVTFSNRIVLYHDVERIFEKSKSLLDVLNDRVKGRPGMEDVLAQVTDETGNIDHGKVLKLLQSPQNKST